MLSIRPFANLQSQHQQSPTSQIYYTYMLTTFLARMLITITVVVKLLAAMEELSHHGIWATAHSAALFSRRSGNVSTIT
jgi:hypothetical protein